MPASCHVCRRTFPPPADGSPLPAGRRLAFDPERGRLWLVCEACGTWNLTAIETRWEAVEACERLFAAAEVRASSTHVGLARTGGVELVRIGAALRDELANWRYGPRLRRRRRLAAGLVSSAGVVVGAAIGLTVLGVRMLGPQARQDALLPLYLATAAGVVLWPLVRALRRRLARARDVRFTDGAGRRLRIPLRSLRWMRVARHSKRSGVLRVDVTMPLDQPDLALERESTLRLLHAALPRLNWRGATPEETARATAIVDEAEALVASELARGAPTCAPWEMVVVRQWAGKGVFEWVPSEARLALEMAVTEEMERRALAHEASTLTDAWRDAEEVAGIADDLLLPRFVSEWIERHRRPTGSPELTMGREERSPTRGGRRPARTRR